MRRYDSTNMNRGPRFDAARWAAGIIVLAIGTAIACGMLARAPRFTPDGWFYGRTMLEARGIPRAAAAARMDTFYRTTDVGQSPRYRSLFGPEKPATFVALDGLFSTRVLYPRLAASIEPALGTWALIAVSLAAYVVTGLGVYLCVLSFARPLIAGLAAAILYADPLMQLLARSALSDMTAIALWSLLLATLCALPSPRPWRYVAIAIGLEAGLMFTRPLVYLPFGAAFFAYIEANHDPRRRSCMALVVGVTLAVTIVFLAAGAIAGTPGIAESVRWLYDRSVEQHNTPAGAPIWRWYGEALVKTFKALAPYSVRSIVTLLAVLSLFVVRSGPRFALFAGAIVGGLAAVPLNPDPNDVERTLFAPLVPVFVALIALALERLMQIGVLQKHNSGNGSAGVPLALRRQITITNRR
jgi:hypothetical protein